MTVGEAFFKHIKPRRVPSLVGRALRNLDSGQYAVPASYKVLLRYPAEELKNARHKPLRLNLPENQLMLKFYQRHPEAKLEPVNLRSSQPPLARQFALRQLELMQQGAERLQEEDAFALAEREFMTKISALRRSQGVTAARLSLQQNDETKALSEALEDTAAHRG